LLRSGLAAALLVAAAVLLAAPGPAAAQEGDEYSEFVTDTLFQATPRAPVAYSSIYSRDQARGIWSQTVDYHRSAGRFAIGLDGGTSTSEDLLGISSKNTSGDISGRVDWRATHAWVLSMDGRYSMNSISDGSRASRSEQRRNRLAIKSQYSLKPIESARLALLGSSEFQQNHDLRLAERLIARKDSTQTDTLFSQRDSSYFSGRLDALRAQLDWNLTKGVVFKGIASGSRIRPTTDVRSSAFREPQDGSPTLNRVTQGSVSQPADNALLDGTVTYSGVRATTIALQSRRSGIDQVYFDLGQLRVEQFSNDSRRHTVDIKSAALNPVTLNLTATLNSSHRVYEARPNLNARITTREIGTGIGYTVPGTMLFTNFIVNRTRAEEQATSNGVTLSRLLTANASHRLMGRLWLEGLGSASLFSYQYLVPPGSNRTVSTDDRDIANAFGSIGLRFAITPRCSTTAKFSVNRSHNVSIDETRSAGNIATTVYQLNGTILMPLTRDVSISQTYVLSANYRLFDYSELRNDLSRNFRIETMFADTLSRHAYLRLDHRYYFTDRGDFTPLKNGGPRFYGVSQEQFQQIMEGTVGIRPVPGVLLVAKQSLADTRNHDIITERRTTTQQWNLSLGLEVNRSFWDGAGLIGAVRHESRHQNLSTRGRSVNEEDNWITGVTFQKEF
jgi:hypothetical protein